ncbi:MAG: DinB family protein [Acidobacteriota bacterium]
MTTLLDEALEAWGFARDGVIEEIRNLREKDMPFRPGPESRTISELVRHVLESGLLMSGELARDDGDFRRKSYEALLREHGKGLSRARTRKALLASLRRTHANGAEKIRRAGELHMLQVIRRFDGRMGTRLAWMQHGIGHEEYHRGQIALCARLAGRVPALTRKIEGSA